MLATQISTPPSLPDASRRSLADEAYETLKWRILSMEYGPGAFLNEQELCKSLGLGRSPVHQALHRLQYDGLVEILPRKGSVVRSWSPRDINNLVEARMPLEVATVLLAAQRATDAQIRALELRLAEGDALVASADRDGLMRLDRDFHRGLAECTGNPVLIDTLEALHQRSLVLWFVSVSGRAETELVQEQHKAILARIKARDAHGAAERMQAHLGIFMREPAATAAR